jgi:PHD/YefM family antitoxin component YafN of YafNO toxin-antitoxin module
MKVITIHELQERPVEVIEGLNKKCVIITRSDKPVAALLYLDEALLDDLLINSNPRLLRELEEARLEYERDGGIDHEAMKAMVVT